MTWSNGRPLAEIEKQCVLVGNVARTHGVQGEVKVFSHSRCPANFAAYRELVLVDTVSEVGLSFAVQRARSSGDLAILQLDGIADLDAASALVGRQVWVDRTQFPKLEPCEYYWFELVGLKVVTEEGRELGVVASLFNNKAHDILVVTGADREYLIPVSQEILKKKDDDKGILIIAPPPGLLELHEEEA
jgi:16S rRNA processing protein RimM